MDKLKNKFWCKISRARILASVIEDALSILPKDDVSSIAFPRNILDIYLEEIEAEIAGAIEILGSIPK